MITSPHKGYVGHYDWDEDAQIFHGEVVGINTTITFQGESVEAVCRAFTESVEDYLDWAQEEGFEPEPPR